MVIGLKFLYDLHIVQIGNVNPVIIFYEHVNIESMQMLLVDNLNAGGFS